MSEEQDTEQDQDYFLFGDATDLEVFKAQVQTLFVSLSNEIDKRLQLQAQSIEKIEEQFATLYVGFVEQAAVLEHIIVTIFADNAEAEKVFYENLDKARENFFNILKEGADSVLAPEDEQLAATIKNVVDKKLSN
jgi:hypothetical protein